MANSLSFLFSIVYGTLGGRVNPALAIPFLALSTFDPSYTVSSPGGYDVPWPSHPLANGILTTFPKIYNLLEKRTFGGCVCRIAV
jgi:hypothetical protein